MANAFPNLLFCPNTPAIAPRESKAIFSFALPICLSISVCFCPLACCLYKFLLFSKRSVSKANSCSFNNFCLSNLASSLSICSASNCFLFVFNSASASIFEFVNSKDQLILL
jgi:hypothetical protein